MRLAHTFLLLLPLTTRAQDCEPRDAFTMISFDNARLARSNLGGITGRCEQSTNPCTLGPTTAASPRDLFFENLGTTEDGQRIDLRVVK